MELMKAARLEEIGKPLEIMLVPKPQPQAGEVLVRVRAAGICSSDLHYSEGSSKVTQLPITLGHEVAGEIVALGEGVNELQKGDRVCLFYLITCGRCTMCSTGRDNYCSQGKMLGKNVDGGFAEYVSIPAQNAYKISSSITFSQAALLTDAVATPFHALRRADVRTGDRVLIIGIGGLGLHAVQIAKIMGAGQVIAVDINPAKLELAKLLGATSVANSRKENLTDVINSLTEGQGVDVAVELIGLVETIRQAIDLTGKGGRVVTVGICPEGFILNPYHDILLKERTIMGSADQCRADFPVIIELASQGRLDLSHSVTAELPLEKINLGLKMLKNQENNPVRIVVKP
jgi:D-arabinose 1-dehydrogenase-like Zn-dependent alcohol dehydrogenase